MFWLFRSRRSRHRLNLYFQSRHLLYSRGCRNHLRHRHPSRQYRLTSSRYLRHRQRELLKNL